MIPHLFRPHPIPKSIPKELDAKAREFAASAQYDEEYIKKCFMYLEAFQKGNRGQLIIKFRHLFRVNLDFLFPFHGYFHCTTINFLLRVMLVHGGRIQDSDIRAKFTTIWWIFPHQYLRITLPNGKFINADPWAYRFGVEFGDYAHGFHSGKILPVR